MIVFRLAAIRPPCPNQRKAYFFACNPFLNQNVISYLKAMKNPESESRPMALPYPNLEKSTCTKQERKHHEDPAHPANKP
jgi:hypothetical protein